MLIVYILQMLIPSKVETYSLQTHQSHPNVWYSIPFALRETFGSAITKLFFGGFLWQGFAFATATLSSETWTYALITGCATTRITIRRQQGSKDKKNMAGNNIIIIITTT
jgi:hypothetical protein